MKKKMIFAISAAIVAVAAVFGVKNSIQSLKADDLFYENVDVLASGESDQKYHNAKLIYCPGSTLTGCKGALMRTCYGPFCD